MCHLVNIQRGVNFRDNPNLGDGNLLRLGLLAPSEPPYFRDNPNLGDGNKDIELCIIYQHYHFRDNPNLGDGNRTAGTLGRTRCYFRDNPNLGDGNAIEEQHPF